MVFELMAAIVAGFGAAGLALLARRLIPALPKWLVPVAAGVGMIGFAISSEYGWGPRTERGLPAGMDVVSRTTDSSWFRPWTYVVPIVTQFTVVDRDSAQTREDAPGMVAVDVYRFARYVPPSRLRILFDCEGRRRAVVSEAGDVVPNTWVAAPAEDPLVGAMCAEPAAADAESGA